MGGVAKSRKVAGSSLVEVTVAMVILTLTVSLGLAIFLSVTNSGGSLRKLKCAMLATAHTAEAVESRLFLDAEIPQGDLTLFRRVSPYQGNRKLLLVETFVTGEAGDTLARHGELVYVGEGQN
jgi:Tfp pilus assembly protein PilV